MAFALLKDPAADAAQTELIQRVAEGRAPWDEGRLGTLLNANAEALAIMQRGSVVRDCDWGVEYDQGPNTPIAHLAKARTLGRLNVLSGVRLAARGQVDAAIDRWLVGVRFSQHVSQRGTLISLLSANAVLVPTLNALADATSQRDVSAEARRRVQVALEALPETGFDWADAMQCEGEVLADALRLPPEQADNVLADLDVASLPLPSAIRINSARQTTRSARRRALDAISRLGAWTIR